MAPNNAREKPVSREKIVYKHLFYCVKIVRKYLIIQVYWAIFYEILTRTATNHLLVYV